MAKDQKPAVAPSYESDLRLEYTYQIVERRIREGKKLPLQVMLEVMDIYEEQKNYAAAANIANQAAPYVHPKLKDVVISGGGEGSSPVRMEVSKGLKGLSDKEFATLGKLLEKASGE